MFLLHIFFLLLYYKKIVIHIVHIINYIIVFPAKSSIYIGFLNMRNQLIMMHFLISIISNSREIIIKYILLYYYMIIVQKIWF